MKSFKQFLAEKDFRQKIVQNVKVHPLIADYAHGIDPNNSMWIANRIRDELLPAYIREFGGNANKITDAVKDPQAKPESEPIVKKMISDYLDRDAMRGRWMNIMDWIRGMHGAVNLRVNPRAGNRPDKSFSMAEAEAGANAWHDMQAKKQEGSFEVNEDPKLPVVMKFPDGFYWIDLKCNSSGQKPCADEAKAMGHCGTCTKAETMLSLRKDRVPHVTLAVKEGRNSEYSVYVQCKGRKNEKPVSKYFPYIVDFFIKYKVERYESDYNPKNDFHPSDLDSKLFLKLIDGDPDIMNFPDVPILAYTHGLIPLDRAIKSLHVKEFSIDESGVKIQIPKQRRGIVNSMYMFPELAGMQSASNLSVEELESIIGWLHSRMKDDAKYKAVFVDPLENVARWYLEPKGFIPKAGRRETYSELLFGNALLNGDPFATAVCEGIVDAMISENKAMIFPIPPVRNEEGEIAETDYDKVPVDVTDRIVKAGDGSTMSLTVNEYIQLVESGGGNFDIQYGYEYLQNYVDKLNKGELNSDSRAMEEIEALKAVVAKIREIVSKKIEGGEDKNQMKFAFADEFTPDYGSRADAIMSGEERA